jgi:type IV pilus assembly protein PilZ
LTAASTSGYDGRVSRKRAGTAELQAIERRASPRVLVDLEVDCRSEETYLFAGVTDISATGIFIRTTTPEPPGTHLNLRLAADDGKPPLELEGEVIWVNPFRPDEPDNLHPGMGVRFHALDEETESRLLGLIRRIAYLSQDT